MSTTTTIIQEFSLFQHESMFSSLFVEEEEDYSHHSPSLPWYRVLQEADATATNQTTVQSNQSINDAATLRNTVRLYGIFFLAVLFVFCWLRKKYPRIYNIRNWVDDLKTPLAKKQFGFLSWMYKLYLLSDTELLDECGMDALCYTRVLEFGVKLAAMGILVSLILIPVYVTAPESNETQGITDIVVRMSTTNVPSGDLRFLATVLGAYVIFGYAMYNILWEFNWFYLMRFQFLKKPLPRNYTVYVRCIPEEYLSPTQFRRYFERFSSRMISGGGAYDSINTTFAAKNGGGVLESTIALETPHLQKKVAEREKILAQLEHAINVEDVKETIVQNRTTGLSKVEVLWEQLEALNDEISAILEHIEQLEESEDRQEEVRLLNEIAEDQSVTSWSVDTPQHTISSLSLTNKRASLSHSTAIPTTIGEDFGETDEQEKEEEEEEENGGSTTESNNRNNSGRQLSASSVVNLAGSFANRAVGAAANTVSKTANAAAGAATGVAGAAMALFSSEDGKPLTAGFVTFTNLQATYAAMQMIQYPQPFAMEVMEAPSPNDIIWSNVGKKHKDLQIGKLISFSLTAILCLFWTIPMSFISSLSTIDGLRKFEWINRMLEYLPWLEPVLAQLAPLLVVLANQALKWILEFLSSFEGPISGAVIQASLFGKLSVFMIIQTFFVSAISGSLISQLTAMLQDTSLIIDLLANSLPKQSTYFIQILLVDTSVSLSVELLRVSALAQAAIRSLVGPNLTEKERQTTWMGIRPLADPSEFGHADLMAITVLYFVVFFVYAVLAPITSAFMLICFVLIGSAYRHQLVYIYPTDPDSGGCLYVQFMKLMPSCILIGEVTIVGFLALKKTPAASALMIPLLIITILFVIYLGQQHFKMTKFLSSSQCMDTDRKNNIGRPMNMEFLKGQYIQPELREKRKYPENVSLERRRRTHFGMSKAGMYGDNNTTSFSLDGSTTSNYHQRGALEGVLGGRDSSNGNVV